MKNIYLKVHSFKKVFSCLIASAMLISMVGCSSKDGAGSKEAETEDTRNMVYASNAIELEGVQGDISNFVVKGDKIYFNTYEWLESESGEDSEIKNDEESDVSEEEAAKDDVTEDDTAKDDVTEDDAVEEDSTAGEEAEQEDTTEEDTTEEGTTEEGTTEENTEEDINEEIEGTTIYRLYVANLDGSGVKEIPLPELSEGEYMSNIMISDSGKIVFLLNSYDEKKDSSTYSIMKIDESGQELGKEDITKILDLDQYSYFSKVMMDSKERLIVVLEQSVKVLDENYQLVGEIKSEDNAYLEGAAVTRDGNIICGFSSEDGAQVKVLDIDDKKWGETIKLDLNYFSSSNSLMDGTDEYDFYYQDDSGIYGYSLADNKSTKAMDYVASNLTSENTYGIIPIGKDTMLGTLWDESGTTSLVKYTKVDPSEIKDKTVITFGAMYVDDSLKKAAIEFNKANTQYQIEFKDYSNEEDATTKMNADIIAGNIPDILCLSSLPIEQYASKGILEDLNSYFENDSELNTSDLIPSLYEASQIDGKLYYIAPSFSVCTLVAKADDVGKESGWTFDDLKALLEEKGDSARPFYSENKSDMLYSFLNMGLDDFIDWQTGKCSFDQQDFKDILEICNSIGVDEENEYDEDGPSFPTMIKEGKILFNEGWVSLDEIQLYEAMYDGDITFIGYPNKDKEGSYFQVDNPIGIYSKSEVKDGAWEFIRTLMTKEYQGKNGNIYNAPTRQDCFDMFIKTKTATEKYTDEFGQEIEPYNSSWTYDDLEVNIKPASQQEVDMYKDLINSTKKMQGYNDSLMEIVQEEAKTYFAGEKSLEETIKIIQNRVETYVNENK